MDIPSYSRGNMSCDNVSDDSFDDCIAIFCGFTVPYYRFEDGAVFEATEFGFFAPEGAECGCFLGIACGWTVIN